MSLELRTLWDEVASHSSGNLNNKEITILEKTNQAISSEIFIIIRTI